MRHETRALRHFGLAAVLNHRVAGGALVRIFGLPPPAHSATPRVISMWWDTAVSGCVCPGPQTRRKWVPGGDVRRVWAKSEVFPGFLTCFGPWLLVGFVRGANRLTLLSGRPPCVTDLIHVHISRNGISTFEIVSPVRVLGVGPS